MGQREIVEDTDPRLVYTGPQRVVENEASSGGTHTDIRANDNGYVTFSFRGTRFRVYAHSIQRDQQRFDVFINDLVTPVTEVSPPRVMESTVLYTSEPNRATNVPAAITHGEGTTEILVNQRTGGGSWNVLGSYLFLTGGENAVTISNANTNGFVIVDAVRFILLEPVEPVPPAFADWMAGFAEVPPDERGPPATPARDGVANLLKYAVGRSPLEPAGDRLPMSWSEPGEHGQHLYMRYTRLSGGTDTDGHHYTVNDLVYRVGVSADLENWSYPQVGDTALVEHVGAPLPDPDQPGVEHIIVRLVAPLDPSMQARAFLRLSVDTDEE